MLWWWWRFDAWVVVGGGWSAAMVLDGLGINFGGVDSVLLSMIRFNLFFEGLICVLESGAFLINFNF
ncbi:hypothetical protein HanHA300_Chr17g0672621 [Helianthus annuus]|nr:hypothetical protein HanHA300_Chr17g0672621 [Helianthus annuus]KAJ0435773.1 hypothetical protein HanIR_Chr17g0897071 [Helianthus annuus]KAJ0634060.1 hypothetical protein HanLR1_Chr17g0683901 [Helianthus annuus]